MATFFMVCAILGGVILVVQFLFSLVGMDHHGFDFAHGIGDIHHDFGAGGDHDASWFFGMLSFRALVAAVAFFGIGGLVGATWGMAWYVALLIGLIAGVAAMALVAWLMSLMYGLQSEGNVHIEAAVGQTGTVYLTIPSRNNGTGKVTVKVQNRTMEYLAVTPNENQLPTGVRVVVTGVVAPDTVEVGPVPD